MLLSRDDSSERGHTATAARSRQVTIAHFAQSAVCATSPGQHPSFTRSVLFVLGWDGRYTDVSTTTTSRGSFRTARDKSGKGGRYIGAGVAGGETAVRAADPRLGSARLWSRVLSRDPERGRCWLHDLADSVRDGRPSHELFDSRTSHGQRVKYVGV